MTILYKTLKSLALTVLSLIAVSCGTRNTGGATAADGDLAAHIETVVIAQNPSVLTLPGYGLSDYCHENNRIYSYNYKEHAIDMLALNADSVCGSIRLACDGPDAIMKELHGLKVYSPDTIITYDWVSVNVIDSTGSITQKIELPTDERSYIDCNARSNISGFKLDFARHSLMYPVGSSAGFEVIEYDYQQRSVLTRIPLKPSENKGNYGFMRCPNVSFNGDRIIYNYPYESTVFVHDCKTDSTVAISTQSTLHPDNAAEYGGNSPDHLNWYGAENIFNTPLYYLPAMDSYVRITLGPSTFDRTQKLDEAYYDRPFYATVFDGEFNPVEEVELPSRRYSPYGGWCAMNDRMALFHDNMFDEHDDDTIVLDFVTFKP